MAFISISSLGGGGAVYSSYNQLNFGTLVSTGTQNGESQKDCLYMTYFYQNMYRNNSTDSVGALYVCRSSMAATFLNVTYSKQFRSWFIW